MHDLNRGSRASRELVIFLLIGEEGLIDADDSRLDEGTSVWILVAAYRS